MLLASCQGILRLKELKFRNEHLKKFTNSIKFNKNNEI